MPDQSPDAKPPSGPEMNLAPVDLEALLEQASRLTDDAVAAVGRGAKERCGIDVDLEGGEAATGDASLVEQQLDVINELVAKANVESAAWAATGESLSGGAAACDADVATAEATEPAVAAEANEHTESAKSAEGEEATGAERATAEAGVATEGMTEHGDSAEPVADAATRDAVDGAQEGGDTLAADAAHAGAAAAEAVEGAAGAAGGPAPESKREGGATDTAGAAVEPTFAAVAERGARARRLLRLVDGATQVLMMLLWPLNRPFRWVGDEGRQLVGIVGMITLLAAISVWLLPLLKHR